MKDEAIEQQIQAKGLTAPRVTPDRIDELMSRVVYTFDVRPNGSTTTLANAFLDGNFYLATGYSACVSVENFNAELGMEIAEANAEAAARDKLWELEGYALRTRLTATPEQIAKVAHEVNRAYCQSLGDYSQPLWEDAPEWQRSSAINGAKFHLENPGAGPDHSHNEWLKEKTEAGWKYGPVKNPEAKEHPCFVPYGELPTEQKAKDFLFRGVVRAMATIDG